MASRILPKFLLLLLLPFSISQSMLYRDTKNSCAIQRTNSAQSPELSAINPRRVSNPHCVPLTRRYRTTSGPLVEPVDAVTQWFQDSERINDATSFGTSWKRWMVTELAIDLKNRGSNVYIQHGVYYNTNLRADMVIYGPRNCVIEFKLMGELGIAPYCREIKTAFARATGRFHVGPEDVFGPFNRYAIGVDTASKIMTARGWRRRPVNFQDFLNEVARITDCHGIQHRLVPKQGSIDGLGYIISWLSNEAPN